MISWCKYRECGRRANQATQAWNRGAVGAFLRRHGACIIWSNSHGVSVPARVSGSPNAFLWRGLAAVGIAVVLVRSADTARSGSFHFQPPPLPSPPLYCKHAFSRFVCTPITFSATLPPCLLASQTSTISFIQHRWMGVSYRFTGAVHESGWLDTWTFGWLECGWNLI
jgi:hypothetical protein